MTPGRRLALGARRCCGSSTPRANTGAALRRLHVVHRARRISALERESSRPRRDPRRRPRSSPAFSRSSTSTRSAEASFRWLSHGDWETWSLAKRCRRATSIAEFSPFPSQSVLVAAIVVPTWEHLALIRTGPRFGERDPFFQMDLSFYVAWLPLEFSALHVGAHACSSACRLWSLDCMR